MTLAPAPVPSPGSLCPFVPSLPHYLSLYIVVTNAVVTRLRKAASYEQRKTNLGNQNFRRRIITKCHVLRSTNGGILVTVT